MTRFFLIKGVLTVLLVVLTACINYTHRVSYHAYNEIPTIKTSNDPNKVIISASLVRQPTSHFWLFPLVYVFGMEGEYAFSFGVSGTRAKDYQRCIIRAVAIETPTGIIFQTVDSTFVRYVVRAPEDRRAYGEHNQYYRSSNVIHLNDSINHVSMTVEYSLITLDGARENCRLQRKFLVDREKGFSLFSI